MLTNKDWPKISIVTPSYNQGKYLEQTILSVIDQNYPNLEYIIIDGSSTDGSVDIIRKYEKHLKYWVSEPDNGMYEAIQKGFRSTTGEIMSWINADDLYHHKSLFVVAELFELSENINWITGARSYFDESGRIVRINDSRQWSKYHFYTGQFQWIQQGATFWTRKLWDEAGGYVDESLKYAGDFELWVRFFRYEKLFNTQAAIGGFRFRTSNQLSLDHRNEYFEEVRHTLSQEIKRLNIHRRIQLYKLLFRVVNVTSRLKLFNTQLIKSYMERRLFDLPPLVFFDRTVNKFKITESENG